MSSGNTLEHRGGNWYVLLVGVPRLHASVILADGIALRPIESPLSVFDLAAAGGVGFREWAMLEPFAGAATCEIESSLDAATTPGYDPLNRAWLAGALLVLRGYTHVLALACSKYSWNVIAGHQKRSAPSFHAQLAEEGVDSAVHEPRMTLPGFSGGMLDYHLRIISTSAAEADSLCTDDLEWLAQHYEVFNKIAAETASFRFALEAAVDWRYSPDLRAALARIWAGIEAVYGINSELVFRVSLLSACLLEPRGDARRQRFNNVKKLYGIRSKAVHGESVSDEKLTQALDDSFRLLADLLLLSAEKGRALNKDDFERAVFGSSASAS
ncbi:MAG: hypothetical protein WD942_04195 [Dehalococcoidia bacterium]